MLTNNNGEGFAKTCLEVHAYRRQMVGLWERENSLSPAPFPLPPHGTQPYTVGRRATNTVTLKPWGKPIVAGEENRKISLLNLGKEQEY